MTASWQSETALKMPESYLEIAKNLYMKRWQNKKYMRMMLPEAKRILKNGNAIVLD